MFDIEKFKKILIQRKAQGFGGWPVSLKESEIKEIIQELEEYRKNKKGE